MPAYIVVDCEVTDPIRYEAYNALARSAIVKHGGRYIVRRGKTTVLEGQRQPRRIVVVEFPSQDAIRRLYSRVPPGTRRARGRGADDMISVAGA